MDVDDDVAYAEGAQAGESDFEEGAAGDFHEGFGTSVGERAEARAKAGGENHGFHGCAFMSLDGNCQTDAAAAEEAAERLGLFVIPSEARNLSLAETQEKRDSSLRGLRSE